jgi:hypothetical protein
MWSASAARDHAVTPTVVHVATELDGAEVGHTNDRTPRRGERGASGRREWWTCLFVGVRDAACHANVSITSAYLHVAVEDEEVGELFGR